MFTQDEAVEVEKFIESKVKYKEDIYDVLRDFSSLKDVDEYICRFIGNEFNDVNQDIYDDYCNFREFIWSEILKC